MNEIDSVPARRAALLLHGLPPTARRQVIAKLEPAEWARLKALLAELDELGVPASLAQRLHDLPQIESTDTVGTFRQRAERLRAPDVSRALQGCAAVTVAQFLRSWEWPWKQRVLDGLPESFRTSVLQHLGNERCKLPPAAFAAMCERLCLQAARIHAGSVPPSAASASCFARSWRRIASRKLRIGFRRLSRWTP